MRPPLVKENCSATAQTVRRSRFRYFRSLSLSPITSRSLQLFLTSSIHLSVCLSYTQNHTHTYTHTHKRNTHTLCISLSRSLFISFYYLCGSLFLLLLLPPSLTHSYIDANVNTRTHISKHIHVCPRSLRKQHQQQRSVWQRSCSVSKPERTCTCCLQPWQRQSSEAKTVSH